MQTSQIKSDLINSLQSICVSISLKRFTIASWNIRSAIVVAPHVNALDEQRVVYIHTGIKQMMNEVRSYHAERSTIRMRAHSRGSFLKRPRSNVWSSFPTFARCLIQSDSFWLHNSFKTLPHKCRRLCCVHLNWDFSKIVQFSNCPQFFDFDHTQNELVFVYRRNIEFYDFDL